MSDFLVPEEKRKTSAWLYAAVALLSLLGAQTIGAFPLTIAVLSRVPKKALALSGGADIANYFSTNGFLVLNLLPFVIGFLILWGLIHFLMKQKLSTFITVRPTFDWKRFFTAFALWFGFLLVLFLMQLTIQPQNIHWNFHLPTFAVLFLISFCFLPIQTLFEEIIFRGVLFQMMGKITQKGIAVVLSNGLFFAFVHLMNPEVSLFGASAIFYYCISGVFTAMIVLMDNGIELSWGFHAANNFFGVLIVSNSWSSLRTDALLYDSGQPEFGIAMWATMLIGYPLMLIAFTFFYSWKNWKARLLGKA